MKALLIVLALLVAACASSPPNAPAKPPTKTHPAPRPLAPLSARVILPSRTMAAGSSLQGHLIIENNTGHAIRAFGCGSLFQVMLVGRRYHPQVVWPLCLQSFTIRTGRSSYRVTVAARYNQCSQGRPSDGVVACLPGGEQPPLPPGSYRAVLFQSRHLFPTPPAIAMRLTSRR